MSDAPQCAADPRPNGVPYYIDSDCPDCGTGLVLNDELVGSHDIWHDEWTCPECRDGLHMDWPPEQFEELERRADSDKFVPLDDIDPDA